MHPSVEQKYKDAQIDYFENANDRNEKVFFAKVKSSKKPVTHKIIKVVRTKSGDQEYVYYQETLKSRDYLNNPIDHSRTVGKYDDPEFSSTIDPRTNEPRANEVIGTETKYEIVWTPNIIDTWIAEEGFELDDGCGFVVKDKGKVYGGYTYDQFCSETYDNLVLLGKYGTKSPEGIQKEIRKRNARKTQESSQ